MLLACQSLKVEETPKITGIEFGGENLEDLISVVNVLLPMQHQNSLSARGRWPKSGNSSEQSTSYCL